MHKKTSFLRDFQKNRLFACVFCTFFASPVFAALPEGYTELKYIESTGTQWIDTGFKPDVNTKIHTKIISIKRRADASIFGCGTNSALLGGDNYVIDLYMSGPFIGIASNRSAYTTPVSTQFNTPYEITFTPNNNELKINDNVFNVGSRKYTSNLGAYLFARNYNNNADLQSIVQMYYFEIYANNILVRNFIPAKHISDNVVGMYDTVTGQFFTNQGTGDFIAGPIAHCKTFETDGVTCAACKSSYKLDSNGGCVGVIEIATTKMVDEEFAAAEANLATTVQTIESVVSRTIAQTGQIATLHETKQTRPDETCPANMKCLLVQDEDGTPHWYPIIEP